MRKKLPVILLIVISLVVVLTNFRPGTWLTGWDNLHPELNIPLNIQRSVFSVWQEYQGLGLLGGMGHASDILRQGFLSILSFVIDARFLRYIYTFFMLIIGPLGVYKLTGLFLGQEEGNKKNWAAYLAGLFYLLNLATVQVFYVPFEAFITHYGFLPWLFYIAVLYYKNGGKKYLSFLLLVNLLSLTQGYVPTIFAVYLISLFIFFAFTFIRDRKFSFLKRIFNIFLIIFVANAFWLFPFTYFTVTSAHVVGSAHENFMATEDIYLRNKEFGTFANVSILKGFWFKFVDMDLNRNFNYMALPWRDHLSSPVILGLGYLLFAVVLLGIYQQIKNRNKFSPGLIILFFFSFAMLAIDTFPFNYLSIFLRDFIPLFDQVFRVPFTKFGILTAFIYSIFFGFGVSVVISWIQNYTRRAHIYTSIIISLLIIIFTFPIFRGYLFYDFVKLKIPQEYFDMISFFNQQDHNTRIANFPQFTYWGWNQFLWGDRGSGFIWYGVPQPILDRAFDGYSGYDENYYWEISKALYSNNPSLFKNILEKYQVGWILIDRNIITSSYAKALFNDKLEEIIGNSNNINLEAVFGKIKVYKVNLNTVSDNFVSLVSDLPAVGPEYKWGSYDKAYGEYGNYISDNKEQITNNKEQKIISNQQSAISNVDIYYPFRSLFTGRQQNELEFGVTVNNDYFSFKMKIPQSLVGYKLILPQLDGKEVTEINANDLSQSVEKIPQVYLDGELIDTSSFWGARATPESDSGQARMTGGVVDLPYIKEGNLEVRVPKINGYYSYNYQPSTINQSPKSCDQFNQGVYKYDQIDIAGERLLQLTSIGSSNCLDFDLPLLSQDLSYLVTVQNKNVEGKSLLFSIINKTSQRADIETYLPKLNEPKEVQPPERLNLPRTSYLIVPPMEQYGLGYTIHLDNISIGREKTINDLGRITVNPIPYRFLTGMKILKGDPLLSQGVPLQNVQVTHPNPSLYQVTVNSQQFTDNNTTLVLSQSFDSGWKAYAINKEQITNNNFLIRYFPFIIGTEIKNHVLVNNWENGWLLQPPTTNNQQQTVIIVYLPQYLEYIGFILLGLGILVVIFYPKSSSNHQLPTIN